MKPKNRSKTQSKLIEAVGEVLAEKGFTGIGVNAVARQAGVDKVLIYRYFGSLDGLVSMYAKSTQFWPSVSELVGEGDAHQALLSRPFPDAFADVFQRYASAIRSRPQTLEILAWETIERNALTIALEEVREETGLELMRILSQLDTPPADWQAIANLFTGAIHYLAIRARKIRWFSGMDLSSEEEWQRLVDSMRYLVVSATMEKEK